LLTFTVAFALGGLALLLDGLKCLQGCDDSSGVQTGLSQLAGYGGAHCGTS
jgi:hypothetical protein